MLNIQLSVSSFHKWQLHSEQTDPISKQECVNEAWSCTETAVTLLSVFHKGYQNQLLEYRGSHQHVQAWTPALFMVWWNGLVICQCFCFLIPFRFTVDSWVRGSSIEWRGHLWWSVKRDEERTKDEIPLVTKTKEADTRPERSPKSSPVDNDKFLLRTREDKRGSVGDKLQSWAEIWARAANSTLLSTQLIYLAASVAFWAQKRLTPS